MSIIQKEKSKASLLSYLNERSKAIIITATIIAVASIAALGGIWSLVNGYNPNIIARVGDKSITRDQLAREAVIDLNKSKYTGHGGSVESAENALIEQKIIDLAAKENNLAVTDAEIDARIAEGIQDGTKVEDLYGQYEGSYGLTKDEFRAETRYTILKEKLSDKLLSEKTGRLIYDRFNKINGVEEITGLKTEELDGWAKSQITNFKSMLDAGKPFDEVYRLAQNDPKYKAPALSGNDIFYAPDFDLKDQNEKDALISTPVGKNSDIVKTKTYYAIYHIDKGGNGKYKSWDDLLKDYRHKYLSFGLYNQKQLDAVANGYNKVISFTNNLLGTKFALADCSPCADGCNGAYVTGKVTDWYTGDYISGATVTGTLDNNSWCNGSTSSSASGWCGYKTKSTTSNTNATGYNYGVGGTDHGNCVFNCAGGNLTMVASKSNYTSVSQYFSITNGSTSYRNFNLKPVAVRIDASVSPAGSGKVTAGGGGTADSVNNGISCDSSSLTNCAEMYYYSANATSFTATPYSGYVFDHWNRYYSSTNHITSINPVTTGHSVPVHMYAYFVRTHTVTFDKNNAAATGTMANEVFKEGETKALTANGFSLANYTFAGWSTSSAGSVSYANNADYTMGTGNVTLYAVWTPITHKVIYNKNNASATGTMADQTFNQGETKPLTTNAFSLQYNDFGGWSTSAGGALAYNNQASFTMGASDVTLYAIWSNNAPVTTLTSPANGSSYAESVATSGINLTANVLDNGDNVDLNIEYALKSAGVYGTWQTVCGYSGSWHASGATGWSRTCNTSGRPITLTAGNTYGWRATGKDDAGLTNTSAIRDFTVNNDPNQAPTITLVSPTYPPTRNFDTGTAVPLVARGEDPDGDTVNITISYQPSGGSWTTLCAYDVGYHAEPWTRTCNMPTTAPAGTYAWHARVTDGSVSVLSVDWYFNLVNPSTPQFSCTVGPDTGNRPLVVRAQITKVNDGSGSVAWASYAPTDPFGINFWVGHAGFEVYQTTADFVNSYANAGTYDVQYKVKYVNQAGTTVDGPWVVCNPTRVTVSDPNSSGGGEVAP
jgi:uncharacterized repeat protein (TIGR02543 family)